MPSLRLSHENGIRHQQKLIQEWNESPEFEELRKQHTASTTGSAETRKKA